MEAIPQATEVFWFWLGTFIRKSEHLVFILMVMLILKVGQRYFSDGENHASPTRTRSIRVYAVSDPDVGPF